MASIPSTFRVTSRTIEARRTCPALGVKRENGRENEGKESNEARVASGRADQFINQ